MTDQTCDVAVVGGGPAGLVAALGLARTGAMTVLIAPRPRPDTRTTALLDGSVTVLKGLGVWNALAADAAPLKTLRVIDAGRRLFRAPEATFHAGELGLEAFGWNVSNARLTEVLAEALGAQPTARTIAEEVSESRPGDEVVSFALAGGSTVTAKLAVAADGARSRLREAAGISFKSRRATQTALAFAVAHETRDHDFVSTELHYEEGPFTLVPMTGRRSSVVWAAAPERAEALRALAPEALAAEATRASGRLLGNLRIEGAVGAFPIVIGAATRFAANRTVLVGEAGHVLPPIGAQGLNLGVRDASAVAEVVTRARSEGSDPGGEAVMRAYARARAADVWTRTAATDLLNRSLMTDLLPFHAARGLGLAAISRIGPLRRFVMREGLIGGPAF